MVIGRYTLLYIDDYPSKRDMNYLCVGLYLLVYYKKGFNRFYFNGLYPLFKVYKYVIMHMILVLTRRPVWGLKIKRKRLNYEDRRT